MVAVAERVAEEQVNAVMLVLELAETSLFFLQANIIMVVTTAAETPLVIVRWFINWSLS